MESYLSEENAELFERLKQTGISDLLDDKDTFWWLVPRQSLAGGVLNVPAHTNTTFKSGRTHELVVTTGGDAACLAFKQDTDNCLEN